MGNQVLQKSPVGRLFGIIEHMSKKIILIILAIIILAAAGFGAWRFYGAKTGAPADSLPAARTGPAQDRQRAEFSNGQRYETFAIDGFSVKYPYWPNLDLKNVPNAENIKVAVGNEGCVFMLKITPIPPDTTFRTYTEQLLRDTSSQSPLKTLVKDVGDDRAYFEGEIEVSGVTMRNVSYTYFIGNGRAAGFAFAAQASKFNQTCQPLIGEVAASVDLKSAK